MVLRPKSNLKIFNCFEKIYWQAWLSQRVLHSIQFLVAATKDFCCNHTQRTQISVLLYLTTSKFHRLKLAEFSRECRTSFHYAMGTSGGPLSAVSAFGNKFWERIEMTRKFLAGCSHYLEAY